MVKMTINLLGMGWKKKKSGKKMADRILTISHNKILK